MSSTLHADWATGKGLAIGQRSHPLPQTTDQRRHDRRNGIVQACCLSQYDPFGNTRGTDDPPLLKTALATRMRAPQTAPAESTPPLTACSHAANAGTPNDYQFGSRTYGSARAGLPPRYRQDCSTRRPTGDRHRPHRREHHRLRHWQPVQLRRRFRSRPGPGDLVS